MHPMALLFDCKQTVKNLNEARKKLNRDWDYTLISRSEYMEKSELYNKLINNFSAFIPLQEEIKKNANRH